MAKTRSFKLALIISLIMGIALGFLYLLERQKIYKTIKENSRSLINQERLLHEQLGTEWDKNLKRVMLHNNLRLYLSEYARNPNAVPVIYQDALGQLFAEITAYKSNLIHRISLISAEGPELIAAQDGVVLSELKDWYSNDYFRDSINRPLNKVLNNQFDVKNGEAYLYKSVPIVMGNKKPVLLTFTILVSEVLQKYNYLLAAKVNDQIVATTRHGKILFAFDNEALDKNELDKVFVALKQKASDDPVLEFGQNIWSAIKNDSQGFYVLFQAKGEKITQVLNDEYLKIGVVFFVSSFILVFLVFFSTRSIQRQQSKVESDKVIHSQRSLHFASISDEIRLPLNALMGALVTLEEMDPEKKQNPYLDSAKKTALQISELVNEFTDFAKINEGNFQLQDIEFDLRTTLNDIADLMSVQAGEKGLEISCLVSSDLPKRVKGDATRLRQILINLISFAIKYTDHGEISLCLVLENHSENSKLVHIDVSDTGNIIDQQSMLEHFQMFTDPAYYTKGDYAGEGLALALSKQLVNLMNGDITVRENTSGGNTFRVSLPMPVADAVVSSLPQDNLKGKRVLIVGEIENNRQMLSVALSKWGMSGGTMNEFTHVPKILREAQQAGKPYHACLIDISLSSLSEKAFEVVRDIRKDFDEYSLGIIVLTVQGAPGDGQIAKDIGVQAFLTKPLTRNSMRDVLMRVFDKSLDKPSEFITRHTLKEVEQDNLVRVLVADADENMQKQLVRLLENSKYQVDLARDGNSLEDAINHNVYDMVLLDLKLPKVDVLNYVKKFRQYEKDLNKALNVETAKLIRLPVIAMSDEITADKIKKCEKHGLDNLISKPVSKEQIQDMLAQHLENA